MLLRLGFVTNSSSTTHIMMWKGDKGKLRELLEAHASHFNLTYEGYGQDEPYRATSDEVASAILSCLDKTTDAKEYAAGQRADAERNQKYVEEENARRPHGGDWFQGYVRAAEDRARRADEFDHVLQVGFGDNHGDFEGGDLGMTMDYEGRFIRIVDADGGFYYTTEQNR
ncbi:MAG: hypothetical protein WCO84_09140 [bacterium]